VTPRLASSSRRRTRARPGFALGECQSEAPAPPPASEESFVQKQVRLVLEQQTHDLAGKLTAWCPAGVGFMLFLADYGGKGNVAYVSSCNREDAIKLVENWLARQTSGGP